MQRTAQDWLVLTQLTHHDASAVGTVMVLQFGPQLLLLPWTGFAADHYNQAKLLMATQTTMGVLALAFDAPVRQTFAAELVGDADLPNAVALNSTSFNAARMIGPAVAGLLIASVGTGWAFLLNGASFLAVLASLFLLRVSGLHANARAHRTKGSLTEGLRYVWSRPDLKAILIMLFLIGTFGLNFPIFISTMAVSVFHTDARGYGLLSSIMAIGTVSGALLAAGRDRPRIMSLLTGAAIFGLGCTLAAVAPGYWLFAGALVVIGGAALTFTNATNNMMQLTTESAMRGRVMALRVAIALGGTPIGAPVVGWVSDHLGPRWALGVGAASGFAAATVAIYAMAQQIHRARGGAFGPHDLH